MIRMKKNLTTAIIFLTLCIALVLTACAPVAETDKDVATLKAGEYIIETRGNAPMKVKVTLNNNAIVAVEVLEHGETEGLSDEALTDIPVKIVEKQSIGIDTISGATLTSNAILSAVEKAIEQAGGNVEEFRIAEYAEEVVDPLKEQSSSDFSSLPKEWDMTYDVIVVGGGFAGLSATYSAADSGARTLLIDKMPMLGGNSQINGGVYASYDSKMGADLRKKGSLPEDNAEQHVEDTMKGGDYLNDIRLVRNFVYGAPYLLDLLLDNGLVVQDSITRPGGHSGYRAYTSENAIGADIVKVQKKMVEDSGADVWLNSMMTQIYRSGDNEQQVVGIRIDTSDGIKNVKAEKGVILATGGFSGNVEMRTRHVPELTEDLPTTNHAGATGEAISIAQEVGANTVHMSYIQLTPFADPDTGRYDSYSVIPFLGPSSGIIYTDASGMRFTNESGRRDVICKAAQNSGGFPTFAIFGQEIADSAAFISPELLEQGIKDKRVFKADTVEELAEQINAFEFAKGKINMSGANLKKTVDVHNGFFDTGIDSEFGKSIDINVMKKTEVAPFYAVPQWPAVHHTMGGLAISPNTQVEDMWGNPIVGLFAAGEVVGGVHGTNRLGANAIPDAIVHGYIAGQVAATGKVPDFVPDI